MPDHEVARQATELQHAKDRVRLLEECLKAARADVRRLTQARDDAVRLTVATYPGRSLRAIAPEFAVSEGTVRNIIGRAVSCVN